MSLSRAFVGFSSPIGYDYRAFHRNRRSERGPNPILHGTTGLLILHDEIWFACEDVCPYSLRTQPFVKFLDAEFPELSIDAEEVSTHAKTIANAPNVFDAYDGAWQQFMEKYFDGHPDNHGRSGEYYSDRVTPNPDHINLVRDLYIIDQLDHLDLVLVGNELTSACMFPPDMMYLEDETKNAKVRSDVLEEVITLGNLYDIAQEGGPWHPVIQELRDHSYVCSFRKWINDPRRDNRSSAEVIGEMESIIKVFNERSLRKYVGEDVLFNSIVDIVRGRLLDLIPGAAAVHRVIETMSRYRGRDTRRAHAFLASASQSVFAAYRQKRRE